MISKNNIPSLIKWTGSKRLQACSIVSYIPEFKRYFEPFVGSGAMLYLMATKTNYLHASDIYPPLIELWNLVKNNTDTVALNYEKHWQKLQKKFPEYYYDVRNYFNETKDPLCLNFLVRTCVNGIIRFNSRGHFNNSLHVTRRGMHPNLYRKILIQWHERLKHTHFHCCDYSELLDMPKRGDFVYLDPPYMGTKQRYSQQLDINRFLASLDKLNRKGVKWALSFDGNRGNVTFPQALSRDLYKRKIMLSNGHSAVRNVLGGSVEQVQESLFSNY